MLSAAAIGAGKEERMRSGEGLIDLHQHVVYGVDDGAKSFEETQAMLKRACETGISHVVATSHITPGRKEFPAERYLTHLAKAQEWLKAERLPLTLLSGAEIYYTSETPRLLQAGYVPTLGETWNVLVEFDLDVTYERICEAVRNLGNLGYAVVIAHIERYQVLRKMKYVEELHDSYDAILQMNANTVLTKRGLLHNLWVRKVLDAGLIDVVASDAHNTSSRTCNLRAAYDALTEQYGEEYAMQRCSLRQRDLLALDR